jgi:plastocyanin
LRVHADALPQAREEACSDRIEEHAMKHRTIIAAALAAAAVAGTTAVAAPAKTTVLTIRHQMHGCHTWSFDGQTWAAAQRVTLARGSALKIVDNDVMSHLLVQLSGPKARIATPSMSHMGAAATVTFAKAGVYTFRTKGGADYMKNVKTMGPDNRLTLQVTVR